MEAPLTRAVEGVCRITLRGQSTLVPFSAERMMGLVRRDVPIEIPGVDQRYLIEPCLRVNEM